MTRCAALFAAVAFALSACGGSDSLAGPSGGGGSMSAVVNGSQWTATIASAGVISGGISTAGGTNGTITLAFAWVDMGTGTYTIPASVALNANLTISGQHYTAGDVSNPGGTGTLTITSLTANRVVGTFTFTLVPAGGGQGSDATVTNGQFDITF